MIFSRACRAQDKNAAKLDSSTQNKGSGQEKMDKKPFVTSMWRVKGVLARVDFNVPLDEKSGQIYG